MEEKIIGAYMQQEMKRRGIKRRDLIEWLRWEYADNDRMMCWWLGRPDRLWWEWEVEAWGVAIGLSEIEVEKLKARAGRKTVTI